MNYKFMKLYYMDRQPYTYLIRCIPTNQYYYGVRYGRNIHPNDLWKTYFTSSIYVKQLIEQHGNDAFEVIYTKSHNSIEEACKWEKLLLTKVHAAKSPDCINKHNGTGVISSTCRERKLLNTYECDNTKTPQLIELMLQEQAILLNERMVQTYGALHSIILKPDNLNSIFSTSNDREISHYNTLPPISETLLKDYQDRGYKDRFDYVYTLRFIYKVKLKCIIRLAKKLGPEQDFTTLLDELEKLQPL